MKKNIKSFAVFIIIALFIIVGMLSTDYVKLFAGVPIKIMRGDSTVSEQINYVNARTGERLSYHHALMDLNSVVLKLTDTKYVKKSSTVIARSEKDKLCNDVDKVESDVIDDICNNVGKLQETAHKNGAEFLYVFAPEKEQWAVLPDDVNNYSAENHDALISALDKAGINTLDLSEEMKKETKTPEDLYFITDHHWTTQTGFWAHTKICERLNEQFGFSYDKKLTDIDNYEQRIYKDWFLGSLGKKIGRFFTPLGIDDLNLIVPDFPTDFTVSIPADNETRNGTFEEAILEPSQLEKKDYYNLIPYDVYGFNHREKNIYNHSAPNDVKILVVSDSYAISVNPFLSLNSKELHIADVRNYEWFVGDKLNLNEYIPKIKPDYVIIIYKGVRCGDGSFDFF
jgi:hypothetical protein